MKGRDTCTVLKDGNETVLVVAADTLSIHVNTKSAGDSAIDSTTVWRIGNNNECNAIGWSH